VGCIALGGIAVETAIVMLLYIDNQVRESRPTTLEQLHQAVSRGAAMRVRPKLMTVTTIFAGLAPIFVTSGLGSDVMRRIALPMLGGMTSTLLLTLVVIPVVYYIWVGRSLIANAASETNNPTPGVSPAQGDSL
jgi:Cu(I)/Ag(I) efflux system membrane protein CusA/SilA